MSYWFSERLSAWRYFFLQRFLRFHYVCPPPFHDEGFIRGEESRILYLDEKNRLQQKLARWLNTTVSESSVTQCAEAAV
jgi:hypothetical protein